MPSILRTAHLHFLRKHAYKQEFRHYSLFPFYSVFLRFSGKILKLNVNPIGLQIQVETQIFAIAYECVNSATAGFKG